MLALELQRADEPGGARELVEREEPQRVAHDHAHPGAREPLLARVAQPAQHHREGREAEVRLGLAAARREEEQVHGLAVRIARVGEAGQVQQDEGELERAPARRLDPEPLAERPRHGAVRDAEGVERVGVRGQDRDAALDPVGGERRRSAAAPRPSRGARPASVAMPARRASIHSRYWATSGRSAASAAAPSASAPSASIESSTPGTSTVAVFSTSAVGIHAVRSRRHAPSTISHSAETPWPVAYSGVSA